MTNKTAPIDIFCSSNSIFNSIAFQYPPNNKNGYGSFDKIVNAGGYGVIDVQSTSCYLRFTEGVTLLGGGSNSPRLGEARESDINPGIDDYYKKHICVFTKNNGNWLSRAGES